MALPNTVPRSQLALNAVETVGSVNPSTLRRVTVTCRTAPACAAICRANSARSFSAGGVLRSSHSAATAGSTVRLASMETTACSSIDSCTSVCNSPSSQPSAHRIPVAITMAAIASPLPVRATPGRRMRRSAMAANTIATSPVSGHQPSTSATKNAASAMGSKRGRSGELGAGSAIGVATVSRNQQRRPAHGRAALSFFSHALGACPALNRISPSCPS